MSHVLQIIDVERGDLGPAQGAGPAQQQNRMIARDAAPVSDHGVCRCLSAPLAAARAAIATALCAAVSSACVAASNASPSNAALGLDATALAPQTSDGELDVAMRRQIVEPREAVRFADGQQMACDGLRVRGALAYWRATVFDPHHTFRNYCAAVD